MLFAIYPARYVAGVGYMYNIRFQNTESFSIVADE